VLVLALAGLGCPLHAQSGTTSETTFAVPSETTFAVPSETTSATTPEPTTAPPLDARHRTPFQLNAQKFHKGDDANASAGLRIQRGHVDGASSKEPPFAPPIMRGLTGAQIDVGDFKLRGEIGKLQGSAFQSAPLPGNVSARALANFEVELIVDQSLSMRRRDCPGRASRWEWCGVQLSQLSDQLAPFTPGGFTLTTFASEFQSYDRATSAEVQRLFANPDFRFGTMLARPLNARMNRYFAKRTARSKPLLIVVITDGAPAPAAEPRLVAQSLIAASKRIVKPGELTIVFFQIGSADRFGRFFLNRMDNSLVAHGARYDIVQTVSFEQLQEQGLTQSLVSAVRSFAHQTSR